MLNWRWLVLIALALIVGGALYIRSRWRRSPQAYRAMIACEAMFFRRRLVASRLKFADSSERPSAYE